MWHRDHPPPSLTVHTTWPPPLGRALEEDKLLEPMNLVCRNFGKYQGTTGNIWIISHINVCRWQVILTLLGGMAWNRRTFCYKQYKLTVIMLIFGKCSFNYTMAYKFLLSSIETLILREIFWSSIAMMAYKFLRGGKRSMGDFFCSSLKFQFSRKFSANHVLTY